MLQNYCNVSQTYVHAAGLVILLTVQLLKVISKLFILFAKEKYAFMKLDFYGKNIMFVKPAKFATRMYY